MEKYKTLQVVRIGAGEVVMLTDEQARDRRPALEALGEGKYRAASVLEFKAGEEIGIEGPEKRIWEVLQPVGQDKTLFDLNLDKLGVSPASPAKSTKSPKGTRGAKPEAEPRE